MHSTHQLYFVRHGETDYNLTQIIQGGGVDSDLNQNGRSQGLKFYGHYVEEGFAGVVHSGLKRTFQTVEPFLQNDLPFLELPELNEMHWGILEGLTPDAEMKSVFQNLIIRWQNGDFEAKIEGGESPLECWNRVESGIQKIVDTFPPGKILICTHGRTLRVILSQILNYGLNHMQRFESHNTALHLVHRRLPETFSLEKYNDISHLSE